MNLPLSRTVAPPFLHVCCTCSSPGSLSSWHASWSVFSPTTDRFFGEPTFNGHTVFFFFFFFVSFSHWHFPSFCLCSLTCFCLLISRCVIVSPDLYLQALVELVDILSLATYFWLLLFQRMPHKTASCEITNKPTNPTSSSNYLFPLVPLFCVSVWH